MTRYFDTSSLVKYFHEESGSDAVTTLIHQQRSVSCISELARLEFKSALYRKFRTKEINTRHLENALKQYDAAESNFIVIPIDSSVIQRAEQLLRESGREKGLRTLDAIHLATYLLYAKKSWQFVVSDIGLHLVAADTGVASILI